jgi:Fe-S cluster assembly scaffold protein SufB
VVSNIDFAVTLQASHTKADIYALSLLGDNAKAKVNGGIVVSPGIIQAEGYLAEENLLLGKKIQIKALPMLDVRSNDVKASHGSTISRLDDQKIFYLTAK